ncbi:MAG: tRNA-dihydrouridine synthase [Candidatus Paceibacterota bacterium]
MFWKLFKKKKIKYDKDLNDSIKMGFWEKFSQGKKPFFVLAPMADVTDVAFRKIIAKYSKHGQKGGGPDVFWTEFVSADGLNSAGREKLLIDLAFEEEQRPIVAQIFGSKEENMEATAKLCVELGFDGIDINFGCPDKAIMKQGCGAGAIQNPDHAVKIIQAVKRGAGDLPVSVKTRLGFNKNEIETWVPKILSTGVAVLTMHGRTKKEMSKVPARWDDIKRVVEIVKESGLKTLVIGNGDVLSIEDGKEKAKESGVNGLMLGRAIFGNPWLFDSNKKEISVKERLEVMLEHTRTFVEYLGEHKNFNIMKKHYKAYVNNFPGAKELRISLMESENYEEIEKHTKDFLDEYKEVSSL